MLKFGNKEFRNLQEQVEKNMSDIEWIVEFNGALNEFGIKVVGQLTTYNSLPDASNFNAGDVIALWAEGLGEYLIYTCYYDTESEQNEWSRNISVYETEHPDFEYGDAYIIGYTAPYPIFVLTRANNAHANDYFINLGEFPVAGPQGPQGVAGPQGPKGDKGDKGDTGNTGPRGIQGETGPQGPIGPQGIQGEQGEPGDIGPKGDTGPQGPAGADGITPHISTVNGNWYIGDVDTNVHAQGPQGIQGPQGETGATGAQGPQGEQGIQGPAGADGLTTSITVNSQTYTQVGGNITLPDYPADVAWGNITGTLSDQVDLKNALDAKQNALAAGDDITITNNEIETIYGGAPTTSTEHNVTNGGATQRSTKYYITSDNINGLFADYLDSTITAGNTITVHIAITHVNELEETITDVDRDVVLTHVRGSSNSFYAYDDAFINRFYFRAASGSQLVDNWNLQLESSTNIAEYTLAITGIPIEYTYHPIDNDFIPVDNYTIKRDGNNIAVKPDVNNEFRVLRQLPIVPIPTREATVIGPGQEPLVNIDTNIAGISIDADLFIAGLNYRKYSFTANVDYALKFAYYDETRWAWYWSHTGEENWTFIPSSRQTLDGTASLYELGTAVSSLEGGVAPSVDDYAYVQIRFVEVPGPTEYDYSWGDFAGLGFAKHTGEGNTQPVITVNGAERFRLTNNGSFYPYDNGAANLLGTEAHPWKNISVNTINNDTIVTTSMLPQFDNQTIINDNGVLKTAIGGYSTYSEYFLKSTGAATVQTDPYYYAYSGTPTNSFWTYISTNVSATGDTQVLKVKCSVDGNDYTDIISSTYTCIAVSATSISMQSDEGIYFTVNDDESFEVSGLGLDIYSTYPYMEFAFDYHGTYIISPINSNFIKIDNRTIVKSSNGTLSAVEPSNMVTTDTNQTISGIKTFNDTINYGHSNGIIKFSGSLLNTEQGLITFETGEPNTGYSYDLRVIRNTQDVNRSLRLVNGSGSGILLNSANFGPAQNNNLDLGSSSYKFKDLYLAGNLSDGTNSISIANIASKSEIPTVPTTISSFTNDSGYITSSAISNMVTTDTAQTITGTKKFKNMSIGWDDNVNAGSYFDAEINLGTKYQGTKRAICSIGSDSSSTNGKFYIRPKNANTGGIRTTWSFSQSAIEPIAGDYSGDKDLGSTTNKFSNLYLKGNLTNGTNSIAIADIANVNDLYSLTVSTSAYPTAGKIGAIKIGTSKYNIAADRIDWTSVPTTDPQEAGKIWNDNGIVKISSGQ